jgi:hypothetical protein
VGTVPQVSQLRALWRPPINTRARHTARPPEFHRLLEDLIGKLTRRCQDQDHGPVSGIHPSSLVHNVQEAREEETEGLAGACLSNTNNVAALQCRWPRLSLDDGGNSEAGSANARHDLRGYRGLLEGEEWVCDKKTVNMCLPITTT